MTDPITSNTHLVIERAITFFTEHPDRWTREAFARRQDGRATNIANPAAHSFCAMGRLRREIMELQIEQTYKAQVRAKVCEIVESNNLIRFNESSDNSRPIVDYLRTKVDQVG